MMYDSSKKKLKIKSKEKYINFVNWRFILLYSCIILMLFLLLGRITWLQIIISDMLVHQENMRSLRIQEISTLRGMITDRYGYPLAVSVPVKAIFLDPKEIRAAGGIKLDNRWRIMADKIKISPNQIITRINAKQKSRFIYLARQINLNIANYIEKLKLPGVHLCEESRRYYPLGEISAQLIGFTNIDSQGIEGVEKSFNKYLTGHPGERIVRKDRYGNIIENISFIDSQAADNLILSIDERLQTLVYQELNNAVLLSKAESGSAILVDINTGEILAMVNSPSYNPNNFNNATKETIRNRAITDVFEPGSTVKPMVIMTAIQYGIAREDTILNTIPYRINGHLIKDVAYYDKLTLTEILQKSSNVGVSKLALAMPFSALLDTYSRFGLGKATNLGLVGEHNGLYPKRQHWSKIEKAAFSFGYGLMVTPLQLARVYATIGSYGLYRPLSIIKINSPVYSKRIFPESIVRNVVHMMESVALPGGVGAKAAVKGYRVAIKTGTVKKVGSNGHYINKYIAYTAGVVPASNPQFALVVIINNPQTAGRYYGGVVSAPVFGAIMEDTMRIMNIKPDALE